MNFPTQRNYIFFLPEGKIIVSVVSMNISIKENLCNCEMGKNKNFYHKKKIQWLLDVVSLPVCQCFVKRTNACCL